MTEMNGVQPLEERLAEAREFYATFIADAMDRILEQFIFPADRQALCLDAAQYCVFLLTLKSLESTGQEQTLKNAMRAYWPIEKAIKAQLPGMFMEFTRELEKHRITADPASIN